ncbi:MAG: hypothetical protein O2782_14530 [bacterium]|nr:hypothetical protein [bacterium]
MHRDNESVYILDMTRCTPAAAVSSRFESGCWTAVDYSIAAGPGKMIFSGPDSAAPPLRLDPGVRGWYQVFVGTYRQVPLSATEQAQADCDIKSVLWGCARSFATYYPSKVGSDVRWSFGLPGSMRHGRRAIERQRQHDFDPLRAAVQCAHEIGIKI